MLKLPFSASPGMGLFVLRIGAGGIMLLAHGLPKLLSLPSKAGSFPDPLGLGSTLSMILAIFAEVFCALAVALGLYTRLATIPLIITMLVAAFIVHDGDPWSKRELAVMYAFCFSALFIGGGGRYTLRR